jgi:hypothetical protein
MEEQTNTQTTETDDTAITLGDVILMYNIISTVSRRGGFEADEFQIVGKLFEKLKTFIPKTEEQDASAAETTNTSEEVEDCGQTQFDFVQEDNIKPE